MGHSLAVRVLEITEYPPTGHGYDTHTYPLPTWGMIESAVRSMNHYCRSFFFIGL